MPKQTVLKLLRLLKVRVLPKYASIFNEEGESLAHLPIIHVWEVRTAYDHTWMAISDNLFHFYHNDYFNTQQQLKAATKKIS